MLRNICTIALDKNKIKLGGINHRSYDVTDGNEANKLYIERYDVTDGNEANKPRGRGRGRPRKTVTDAAPTTTSETASSVA
jgi:hypothetical protein